MQFLSFKPKRILTEFGWSYMAYSTPSLEVTKYTKKNASNGLHLNA